jgi:C_GCAxxG_C_C family probable redox protein
MTKAESAIFNFNTGLNCAQAVLSAYAYTLNFDKEIALSIACGFGGGMGRLQETYGACTGSFMVLGIFIYRKHKDNREKKERTYAMIMDFSQRFRAIFGTTDCSDLLKCDLKTEACRKYIKDHHLHEMICEKYIIDSIRIIEEMMKSERDI